MQKINGKFEKQVSAKRIGGIGAKNQHKSLRNLVQELTQESDQQNQFYYVYSV